MMLDQLLSLLEQRRGAMSIDELARALGAQSDAVAGMLELLARKGRVVELGAENTPCSACKLQSECRLVSSRGTRYLVCRRADFACKPPRQVEFIPVHERDSGESRRA